MIWRLPMDLKTKKMEIALVLLVSILIPLILFLPLELLEFLSLNVVGEPPINGMSWMMGVVMLGGELSMRFLAILGLLIIVITIPLLLRLESPQAKKRAVKRLEIIAFLLTTMVFFIINFIIGYAWWDPNGLLGMGSLFIPSILSILTLGLMPELFKVIFKFERSDFSESTTNISRITIFMVVIAFGYGAISCVWHCCSFYNESIIFFYFGIKAIQLWGMCSFFFRYGFKMLQSVTHEWVAYIVISLLFGFNYPWHTFGYAITFTIFGLLLCYLTK